MNVREIIDKMRKKLSRQLEPMDPMNTLTAGTDRVPPDTATAQGVVAPTGRIGDPFDAWSVVYIDGLRRYFDSFLVVDAHLTVCTTCDGKGTIPCWMFPKHPLPCPDCSGKGV